MNAKCPTIEEISQNINSEEKDYGLYRSLCPDYNRDIMESIKPTVRVMIATGIIVNLILDLVCYKYRRLAKLILYFEGVHGLLFTMIPNRYWLETPIALIGIYYFVMFICFYCDRGAQIIYLTCCLSFQILVVQTLGYNKTNYMQFLGGTTLIVIYFILCSFIAMIIVYTKNLERKKANALSANI